MSVPKKRKISELNVISCSSRELQNSWTEDYGIVKKGNKATNTLMKLVGSNSNIVAASFAVSNVFVKRGEPFCDGEYIKDLMLETAPVSYLRIKNLPITRNTIKDRILKIAENITNQQFANFKLCNVFSICLDESTNITGSA
ncbi:Hypothetical protein CINCED_3A013459 [Cinara cedri]|uniref:DUF4371 domain-containing protein n=1 Tax=Cinara cedri TaxID=506608 RepID=A0A5E4M510_9HEMI|nr:Hypothetical protein CINCED_3A013459 [Cinara cedri]